MKEHVILVNQQDQEIGQAEKITAHRQALCHRAFSVFVLRGTPNNPEILLQKRHPEKYHCGGLWTNTCCGHPRPGEQTQAAAERRLYEELGIHLNLRAVGQFHYIAEFDNGLTENEVDHVFVAHDDGQALIPHPQEVADTQWLPLDKLQRALHDHPEQFTPWFTQALMTLYENFIK